MAALRYLIFFACFYFCVGEHVDYIQRPCARLDRGCVGRIFARELRCALRGKVPDTRNVSFLPLNYPHANSSIEYTNAQVKGLNNFRVGAFYINRRDNKLILELIFNNLEVTGEISRGIFYKKGREPVETVGLTNIIYRNYSITLTVYNIDCRRERNRSDYRVYAYVSDINPPANYSHSIVPRDPQSRAQWQLIIGQWQNSIREKSITQAPLFMSFVAPCELDLSMYQ